MSKHMSKHKFYLTNGLHKGLGLRVFSTEQTSNSLFVLHLQADCVRDPLGGFDELKTLYLIHRKIFVQLQECPMQHVILGRWAAYLFSTSLLCPAS